MSRFRQGIFALCMLWFVPATQAGIQLGSEDAFSAALGGHLQIDFAVFDDDSDAEEHTELRRARLYVKGKLWEDWKYKSQIDFSDGIDYNDQYLAYTGWPVKITVGNFKQPFSLEQMTSSRHITFMERSMAVNAFAPARNIGVGVTRQGSNWSLNLALFDGNQRYEESGYGLAGRGTGTLALGQDGLLHGGLSLQHYNYPGEAGRLDLAQRYGAHLGSKLAGIYNGDVRGNISVDSLSTIGLEAAVLAGPYSMQAEYIRADYDSTWTSAEADGYYIQGSWFLTPNDQRAYRTSSGSFGSVKPVSPRGAWELAARYDVLRLSDIYNGNNVGIDVEALTLGVNWYANPNIRGSANYVHVLDADGRSTPAAFQLRVQVAF